VVGKKVGKDKPQAKPKQVKAKSINTAKTVKTGKDVKAPETTKAVEPEAGTQQSATNS
jgi:hypothetical protein